ncbi:hypothetical protein EJ05DRAFT_497125 [Pseudovirgaria hyperparasitica]|uniref:Uncharacterized protein n=1 Tax=Pseudovirgaria hyperparasitica TaxID=470096 RepID=A0A6A6WHI4_9PEZI|nr:uncharacterized protein EJ05DRAFT_497125 [Pseudovirgaria hyperparasitica]KAF2762263.1 hypothetical protein EJ05DRAFT_497125 [Pseudovirgaria hyperparasitica]
MQDNSSIETGLASHRHSTPYPTFGKPYLWFCVMQLSAVILLVPSHKARIREPVRFRLGFPPCISLYPLPDASLKTGARTSKSAAKPSAVLGSQWSPYNKRFMGRSNVAWQGE